MNGRKPDCLPIPRKQLAEAPAGRCDPPAGALPENSRNARKGDMGMVEIETGQGPLSARFAKLRAQPQTGPVAADPASLELLRVAARAAATDATILVTGPSGAGKEVMARHIHDSSPRAGSAFIAVNCAALPEAMLESLLFGHQRGAFTGAVKTTEGKIELAQGGTLFLDEVGDIPLPLQVKLLRFIQERVIERIGGRKSIEVDTRIVCATHRNLKKMILEGGFREDLYYRIAEVSISIPALRERDGDPVLLANHFLKSFGGARPGPQLRFGPAALAAINLHSWPGNVRELENRVKRATIMADGTTITPADLDLADSPEASIQTLSVRLSRIAARAAARAMTESADRVESALSGLSNRAFDAAHAGRDHGARALHVPVDPVTVQPRSPLMMRPIGNTCSPAAVSSAATASAASGAATTTMPMPQLKVRSISDSATPPTSDSQPKTGGGMIASRSMLMPTPSGSTRGRLSGKPPPVMWARALIPSVVRKAASSGLT